MPETKRIGDVMVARGLLDKAKADAIGAERARGSLRFASVAVKSGKVKEPEALRALAAHVGFPAVDLTGAIIPKAVLQRIPVEIASQQMLLPLRLEGSTLLLAMCDPADWQTVDEISFATGLLIQPHVALQLRMNELIPQAYKAAGPLWRGPQAKPGTGDDDGYLPLEVDPPKKPGVEIVVEVDTEMIADDAIVDDTAEVGKQEVAASAHGGKLILAIEDEPAILDLIVKSLKPLGHEVISATRGLAALKLIKTRRPDLIVVDAMLPEVHGFEICRKVKESKRFGQTPVLMLSAIYRGWRIAADIKATYKVDDFLEKPFRVAELRRRAQQLLERKPGVVVDDTLAADAQGHVDRAMKAAQKKDLEEAFSELRHAEAIEPFSAKVQFLLAQILEKRDRVFQAIYHYERSVELKPDLFAATKSLAMLYQARGFKNKAIEMWERSMRAAPNGEVREQIKSYLVSML